MPSGGVISTVAHPPFKAARPTELTPRGTNPKRKIVNSSSPSRFMMSVPFPVSNFDAVL